MAILVISKEMWDTLEHTKAQLEGRYEIKFVPEKEYTAILADMFKTVGTAPKKEGGKKQKGEEAEE